MLEGTLTEYRDCFRPRHLALIASPIAFSYLGKPYGNVLVSFLAIWIFWNALPVPKLGALPSPATICRVRAKKSNVEATLPGGTAAAGADGRASIFLTFGDHLGRYNMA